MLFILTRFTGSKWSFITFYFTNLTECMQICLFDCLLFWLRAHLCNCKVHWLCTNCLWLIHVLEYKHIIFYFLVFFCCLSFWNLTPQPSWKRPLFLASSSFLSVAVHCLYTFEIFSILFFLQKPFYWIVVLLCISCNSSQPIVIYCVVCCLYHFQNQITFFFSADDLSFLNVVLWKYQTAFLAYMTKGVLISALKS